MHILRLAKKHNVVKDSMPSMLLVLSDMQFDDSQNSGGQWKTHYSWMELEYKEAGYKLPKIVFWDLHAHSVDAYNDGNLGLALAKAEIANTAYEYQNRFETSKNKSETSEGIQIN